MKKRIIYLSFLIVVIFCHTIFAQTALAREFTFADYNRVTTGYCSIYQKDDYFIFQRFPSEVTEVLRSVHPPYVVNAEATSGVRLRFSTDTRELFLEGNVLENSPLTESFIILCNDSVIAELPGKSKYGEFERLFKFPGGEDKIIEIAFPSDSKGMLRKLLIDGNASMLPLKKQGILFAIGNSITQAGGRYQGYIDIVARGLNLELLDAGVGGHFFQSQTIFPYVKNPVLITLAYGTNDWYSGIPVENARIYLDRLTSLYPGIPIVMLEPIHRYLSPWENGVQKTKNQKGECLMDYRKQYRKIAKNYPMVTIINYKKLMPDNPALFIDGVHPSREGHVIFGKNLLRIIKKEFVSVH